MADMINQTGANCYALEPKMHHVAHLHAQLSLLIEILSLSQYTCTLALFQSVSVLQFPKRLVMSNTTTKVSSEPASEQWTQHEMCLFIHPKTNLGFFHSQSISKRVNRGQI